MFNYEGQTCEVCKKTFDKNSDIVVCPECGTPHHRRCWRELGHCVNEDKHARGFEWMPKAAKPAAGAGSITCPNCHSVMPRGTLFCENCGTALSGSQASAQNTFQGSAGTFNRQAQQQQPPFFMTMDQSELNARIEKELSGEIDGVRIKDIAVYVGPSAQYYIYKFKKMERNPNYRPFCWSAFLFSPIYYMYRKMWGVAVGSMIFNFLMNIPSLIITAADIGVIPYSSPLVFPGLETAAYVCSLLVMVVSLVLGFTAIPMYKKATLKKLKELKAEYYGNPDEYYRTLMRQSGPSKGAIIIIALMSAFYIFNLFLY